MRTILHIGAEKTGTTALQKSFNASLDRLAGAGILYPRTLTGSQHFELALYAMGDERSHFLGRRRSDFHTDRAGWRERIADKLAAEVEAGPETLLLSSELLAAQLVDASEVRRLKQLLDRWSDDYLVVLYMRRQDRATVSLYSTDLRVGSASADVFGPHPFTPVGFDYARILGVWAEVFGTDRMVPRVYETARVGEDGLIGDFVRSARLPLDPSDLAGPRATANRALSGRAQRVLLEYNRLCGGRPAATREELTARRAVVGEVSRRFPGETRRPSRAEAKAYLDRFARGNAWVAATWFDGAELFDDVWEDYPETADLVPDLDVEELMGLVSGVAGRLGAELTETTRALQAAERRARRAERAAARAEGRGGRRRASK